MQFEKPLKPAILLRRYKRFLADVRFEDDAADAEPTTIHCPNPGSMMGLAEPGMRVWLRPAVNPKAKLPFGWELTEIGDSYVGVNTGRPNPLAEAAIKDGLIKELTGYETIKREVKYGENSRIDLLLTDPDKPDCYVEIKSVTLAREGIAEFPDSKTARGAKHLDELANMTKAGCRAVMLYVVQRTDCASFRLAGDIDPAYVEAYRAARTTGVETLCYQCAMSLDGISLDRALPIAID